MYSFWQWYVKLTWSLQSSPYRSLPVPKLSAKTIVMDDFPLTNAYIVHMFHTVATEISGLICSFCVSHIFQ